MRSRQALLDIFSTFLQFEDDAFRGWAIDTRLRRSMQTYLKQAATDTSDTSEHLWATYWHKCWQREAGGDRGRQGDERSNSASPRLALAASHALALGHLSAYLQEACYWSAQRTVARLDRSPQRLADCFQVAIAAVPKILNAFDSDQLPSLKTYASQAFSNVVRDDLRRRREADYCNDWGLLLKLSRKQLIEALQHAGWGTDEVDRCMLAWTCFAYVYIPQKSPGLRQLAAPDRSIWNAIADRYNQQRRQLSLPDGDRTPATLERWLVSCVSRVRAYLYPVVASLNAPKLGQDAGEVQDDVPDRDQDTLLIAIAAEELEVRQTQQQQINAVLQASLAQLDPTLQQLLQLYYQAGRTQQQIAQQFALQQYAISRKLGKARETLLLSLTRWSQETLHISPTSTVVKSMSAILEEWLQIHYQVDGSTTESTPANRSFQEYL